MAIESPIQESDEWFTGEDKLIQFIVEGQTAPVENVTGWGMEFKLYRRRDSSTAVLTKSTSGNGVTVLDGPAGLVGVQINAADTRDLLAAAESYNYVLRRTDPGAEQILAYGGAVLRQVVGA